MVNKIAIEMLSDHRVIQFAQQQFTQLHETVEQQATYERVVIGTFAKFIEKDLDVALSIAPNLVTATFSDEMVIHQDKHTLYLIGTSPRAVLFAVYHYFETVFGMHWIYPGQEPVCHKPSEKLMQTPLHVAPLIERRGFVIETIDDLSFIQPLVDWLAKNKVNECFFTFTLWDKIGSAIGDMLLDRGIDITLGGHSTSFFLQQLRSGVEADHPYTAKKQLDYSDLSWQSGLIKTISEYCQSVTNLKRISLWPEDIKHQSSSDFLTQYIQFTERLQEGLNAHGLTLDVEHIAYNAGLSWDMLERQGQPVSSTVNTLYAYWGRDYRYDVDQAKSDSDNKAYAALLDWHNQIQLHANKLTIFEYYSDHFMLSPLFPMFAQRISHDINSYASLGIHGITNLIVPCKVEQYSYQWNQNFNSYVFAKACWKVSVEEVVDTYIQFFPKELHVTLKELLADLEREITVLTSWNDPLFPARAVDPLKVSHASNEVQALVVEQLDRIIQCVQSYMNRSEIQSSEPLQQTLVHYERYAREVKQQWLSRSI
jgi:hypothetical protein